MIKKQVSMIRKYPNHTLQTNTRHSKEEPQNTDCHKTLGISHSTSKLLIYSQMCKGCMLTLCPFLISVLHVVWVIFLVLLSSILVVAVVVEVVVVVHRSSFLAS